MALQRKQKTQHMGFELLVKFPGDEKFARVEGLFNTHGLAEACARSPRYARAQYRVKGVRINVVPITGKEDSSHASH